ncbi:L,D-transpeptidase family protein [Fodinicola acaciae]|uniref:L,D-transpeptidase family protein n=1 Tax=Fodinicola acaciae TaxID=2681555 RepID=UPI0013D2EEEC|nr:L,D-transpeptidase family protein [Fodinicola acaciae]
MRRTLAAVVGLLVAMSTFGTPAYASDDACRALTDHTVRFPVGGAKHVVFAVAPDYGVTTVTVTECVRHGRKWQSVRQVDGWAGRAGFAPPGEKREGDGRTPSGSFTLTEAFGEGDPGTRLRYRQLHSTGDCWGSTVTDPRYNRYFSGTCGPDDEDLSAIMLSGPYQQAVVIDYNRRPVVPGDGSAIFFHVSSDKPTAGCIAVPLLDLTAIMRTLRPGDRMVMGISADLFRG